MKIVPLLILPLVMWMHGVAFAQGQSSDEALVRSLDDQERIAALKKDTEALERLWSDQFVGNQPNNTVVADKRALMDALVPRSSYDRQIEFIRVDGACQKFCVRGGFHALELMNRSPYMTAN